MNYIKLLNSSSEKFLYDNRLNPTHINLYMALFQKWNSNRFAGEFCVNRGELMQASKIGSKSTYHRCVKDLDAWGYLCYHPLQKSLQGQ